MKVVKGYQAIFHEYMVIVKEASSRMPKRGPIDVALAISAVNKLWNNVRHILNMASAKMHPFLKIFGAVEGNWLSMFAANIETTEELLHYDR